MQLLLNIYKKNPKLFNLNPHHLLLGLNNYTVDFAGSAIFTIDPRPITFNISDNQVLQHNYGDDVSTLAQQVDSLAYTINGLVPSDDQLLTLSLDQEPSHANDISADAGSYTNGATIIGAISAGNYILNSNNSTDTVDLTINKRNLTIKAANVDANLDDLTDPSDVEGLFDFTVDNFISPNAETIGDVITVNNFTIDGQLPKQLSIGDKVYYSVTDAISINANYKAVVNSNDKGTITIATGTESNNTPQPIFNADASLGVAGLSALDTLPSQINYDKILDQENSSFSDIHISSYYNPLYPFYTLSMPDLSDEVWQTQYSTRNN